MDPFVGGALAGGAIDLVGGMFGNQASAREAAKSRQASRDAQYRAAKIQSMQARELPAQHAEGLKRAGLNRILALGSGPQAAAPMAGMASATQTNPASGVGKSVASAIAAKEATTHLKGMENTNKKIESDVNLNKEKMETEQKLQEQLQATAKVQSQEAKIKSVDAEWRTVEKFTNLGMSLVDAVTKVFGAKAAGKILGNLKGKKNLPQLPDVKMKGPK